MQSKSEVMAEKFVGFDPATLYEAAGHEGMVDPAIRRAWAGARLCGVAFTVECPPGDNLMLHHAVASATPGVILVASVGEYCRAGCWGEVLTAAAQFKGIGGLAVDGSIRDVEAISERQFPVFSRGVAIGSCTKERLGRLGAPIRLGGVPVRSGDIIVGDADGIVIVSRDRADEVYEKASARRIRETEIMEQISQGKTTVELLGLPRFKNGN